MDWGTKLITLYLTICKEFSEKIKMHCQRFTNGENTAFTDEKVMTLYCYGLFKGYRTIKSLHNYANDHLKDWFPLLPGYAAFVHRINRLPNAFLALLTTLQSTRVIEGENSVYLADSFPIALAHHNHAYTAKVAPELANRGYCATKKMHFYGVRAHVVARKRASTLPDTEFLFIEKGSNHDGPVFDQIRSMLQDNLLFGDQAYKRPDADEIEKTQGLKVMTPIKKKKGQKRLEPEQRAFSNAVSRIRQPIETLFGWIDKMTGIENASTVRSSSGLLAHIFGRFAAAMMLRVYPCFGF